MSTLTGGKKIRKVLEDIKSEASDQYAEVGFLSGTHYPDGLSVASIAFLNEFGGVVKHDKTTASIFKKTSKDGDFLKRGKFVNKSESNFEQEVNVGAYSITIPARPFFRNAVTENKQKWIDLSQSALKKNKFDVNKSLNEIANKIKDDVAQSIIDLTEPPNKPSTIRNKKFKENKPLIDTGFMLRSVNYRIVNSKGD